MNTEEVELEVYRRSSLPNAREILAALFRQRRALLIAFGLVILAVAVSRVWVPKYETHMKILVRRQRSEEIVTASANAPTQLFNDQVSEADLNSEVELLKSEDLLRQVVIATGLSGVDAQSADRNKEIKIAKAVRILGKKLEIAPGHKSNVISVSYQSRDPKMAARVLSTLSKAYMEKHLEVHRSSGEFKFFDQEMRQYQQGLDQAQAKLTAFTRNTGIVSADLERDSALRQANEFDTAARQARSSLTEAQQRADVLHRQLQSMKPRTTTVVRTLDNPHLFDQLKSTLLNLELKRTDLLSKYAPTYPLVQAVDQQIAEAKSAIATEESHPIREESSDRDPTYQWANEELTKSQSELSGLRSRAASAASIAAQYRETAAHLNQNALIQQDLMRAAKTQEENYLLYVRKREEARIGEALDQRGFVNVTLAEQPLVPVLPARSLLSLVVLTLLLAGTFSISTALVVDSLDPSFRTPDELANYLGVPVLAALPRPGA